MDGFLDPFLAIFGHVGGVGRLSALAPAQNRLRRFCGPLRAPIGALVDGAKAGLRVVFRVGLRGTQASSSSSNKTRKLHVVRCSGPRPGRAKARPWPASGRPKKGSENGV